MFYHCDLMVCVPIFFLGTFLNCASFILVPWFVYNHYWWQAIFITINYLIAAHLAFKVNPRSFLYNTIKGRKITDISPDNLKEIRHFIKLDNELEILDSLAKKIFEDKVYLGH